MIGILAKTKAWYALLALACMLFGNNTTAQYWTSGGELIFATADYKVNSDHIGGPVRFSLFLHLNSKYNLDLGKHAGLAFGYSVKNLGFATRGEKFAPLNDPLNPRDYDKIVRRSYTLGVPIMLKLGNMKEDRFLAFGAEYDMLFHFKEKRFLNGEKSKRTKWFSGETNRFLPSVFFGIQFSRLGMIKVQYYLDDFLNKSYSTNGWKPYEFTDSRILYFSWMGNVRSEKVKEGSKKLKDKEYSVYQRERSRQWVSY